MYGVVNPAEQVCAVNEGGRCAGTGGAGTGPILKTGRVLRCRKLWCKKRCDAGVERQVACCVNGLILGNTSTGQDKAMSVAVAGERGWEGYSLSFPHHVEPVGLSRCFTPSITGFV